MATVSGTQYDRCSGSTSLTRPAAPMHAISRSVNIQLTCPEVRVRRASGQARYQSLDSARATSAIASRSVSMAGLSLQAGGIIGGGDPVLIASARRDTTSVTSGGGRVPAKPTATAASAIRWLAFSTPSSLARLRFSPVAVDLAVSSSSYAVFSAPVSACRRTVNSSPPTERSSPASASYTAATSRCSRPYGACSQPGRIRIKAQTTPARNPAAVCQIGRSAPIGPAPSEV
jgi:hypothetical protein